MGIKIVPPEHSAKLFESVKKKGIPSSYFIMKGTTSLISTKCFGYFSDQITFKIFNLLVLYLRKLILISFHYELKNTFQNIEKIFFIINQGEQHGFRRGENIERAIDLQFAFLARACFVNSPDVPKQVLEELQNNLANAEKLPI